MKITLNKKEIYKFLNTKEENILIDNIYNDFLTNFSPFVDKNELISSFNNNYYLYFLDKLEIDPSDHDFYNLAKKYSLDNFILLDENKYSSNEYYKTIKLTENSYKINNLSLNINHFNPYECFLYKDIDVRENNYFQEINNVGYFSKPFKYIELVKNDEVWMSITPHEIETMEDDIKTVKGNILVLGLGLGYFPFMSALKNEVTKIDVIELSKEVISLFKENLYEQFINKEKINVINENALTYLEKSDLNKYNYIYIDLYHTSLDALPIYLKTINILNKKNYDLSKTLFWIEKSILAYIRRILLTLIEETINNFDEKMYLKAKNLNDKLINYLYFSLKDINISNKEELENLLKDKELKKLILNFKY